MYPRDMPRSILKRYPYMLSLKSTLGPSCLWGCAPRHTMEPETFTIPSPTHRYSNIATVALITGMPSRWVVCTLWTLWSKAQLMSWMGQSRMVQYFSYAYDLKLIDYFYFMFLEHVWKNIWKIILESKTVDVGTLFCKLNCGCRELSSISETVGSGELSYTS